jgi:hypothetical protein
LNINSYNVYSLPVSKLVNVKEHSVYKKYFKNSKNNK